MGADASQLIPNERIVYETRKHWASVVVDSVWPLLLLLGAIVLTWLEGDSTSGITGFFNRVIDMLRLAAFLVGLVWIIYNVVAWRTAQFTVTNLRVFGHEGLLRRRESETLLTSLSDIQTSQGVLVGRWATAIFGSSPRLDDPAQTRSPRCATRGPSGATSSSRKPPACSPMAPPRVPRPSHARRPCRC